MSKLLAAIILVGFVFVAGAHAQTTRSANDAILIAANGDDYWISTVSDASPGQADSPVSRVRRRIDPVAGRWEEIARLQTRLIDIAAFGGGLAVLTESGGWKIIQPSGSAVDGPAMPDGYHPLKIANAGDSLLAIADTRSSDTTTRQSAPATNQDRAPTIMPSRPALFRWQQNAWTRLADLPQSIEPFSASVLAVDDQIYLAYRVRDAIQIDRFVASAWRGYRSIPVASAFKLVANAPRPLIATQNDRDEWSIVDLVAHTYPRSLAAQQPSDLVMVGPTLRLVYFGKDETLEQLAYDNYGQGFTFGPDVVGQLPLPQQISNVPLQLVILLALSTLTLLTFRQRPTPVPELLAISGIQLAPIARRVMAGLVDAAPLLAMVVYVMPYLEPKTTPLTPADVAQVARPLLIGFALYFIHTTISEMIWRKTLGKLIFGLRIANYDGSIVSRERAFLRNLMRVVDVGLCVPWMMLALTPMQQRLGDVAAKTLVVIDNKK